ncbi:Bcmdm32 [Botrytis cinerea B05.10]|uniref:Bcmdm32 n=2 Tax=Botryotinia fuckeliana TaxID=40559 RepID=A0A384J581_BOTFB|nr:Bcmdm32 [Botrytis cinerea B05.10]ATZ45668.1 Bcmdm32 [Botrytis cinerea B05.10]
MSINIKPRLWSQLWDQANSLVATRACKESIRPFISNSTLLNSTRRAFSQSRIRSFSSSSPKTQVRRSFAYGGVFFLDLSSGTSATPSIASCTTTVEKTLYTASSSSRRPLTTYFQQEWRREIHSSSRRRARGYARRNKSSASNLQNARKTPQEIHNPSQTTPPVKEPVTDSSISHSASSKYHLPHMPKMPHRPTREELLAAATGFWSRLKVRFKWFTIRGGRPWNVDDWSAFVSWFVLGNIAWIFVGTTTFFSLVILSINTVVAQETLARWVGDYLTHSAGIKVVFESAIVPRWKDGVITFRNVFVSRRPGQGKTNFSKGSSLSAAAAAASQRQVDTEGKKEEEEDTNYTQFDVTLDTVNVTLSFVKWWNGKGLLRDVEIKGVRGVIDRTSVHWGDEYIDPKSFRHEHNPGDFEIDSFKLEDLLVTVHQPNGFRPFSVSIFSCDLPQLRKQWLFYDFLSASNMSGAFDGSLFTIHPRQIHGFTGSHALDSSGNGGSNPWKKQSRLRIDGLKIDHLNRGVEGPFGWIHEGNVDIVSDVMLPTEEDDSIAKVMSDFYDRMEEAVTSNRYFHILENNPRTEELDTPAERDALAENLSHDDNKRYIVMDLRIHLNDVKAAVPLFTRDLSYVNQALIRPIVAYINAKKTFIPINCRIVKRASDFDGSWTIFDSGLMDDMSAETYEAFAKDVVDSQARLRRLKKVGFWSISMAIQAIFMGMAGNVA